MYTTRGRPIAVGVNDTAESELALRWAVDSARRHERPLHIVASYVWSQPATMGGGFLTRGGSLPPTVIGDRMDRSLAYARDRLETDNVTSELTSGLAVPVLRSVAATAEMLVVGTRGRATRHSVSRAVAAHATCPVVVVRPGPQRPRRIVVGVDGSVEADQALGFGFEEAALRSVPLEAVHCWLPFGPDAGYKAWIDRTAANLREQVSASVAAYSDKYPAVPVVEEVLAGPPVEQLAARSGDADLMVVGSRGHGRVIGAMLGSVSQGLLVRAECPVAVVKGRL